MKIREEFSRMFGIFRIFAFLVVENGSILFKMLTFINNFVQKNRKLWLKIFKILNPTLKNFQNKISVFFLFSQIEIVFCLLFSEKRNKEEEHDLLLIESCYESRKKITSTKIKIKIYNKNIIMSVFYMKNYKFSKIRDKKFKIQNIKNTPTFL